MVLYIGPGIGIATILIVAIVLLIVAASFAIILWRPVKRWISKLWRFVKSR